MSWLEDAKKRCEAATEPGILATAIWDVEQAVMVLPKALKLLELAKEIATDAQDYNGGCPCESCKYLSHQCLTLLEELKK